jgi:transposase
VLIAECGLDMTVFPTGQHLASWAGICPSTNQSLKALTSPPHYWQIRGRRGDAKAIGATRHDILIAYYRIVRDRVPSASSAPTGSPAATPRTPHLPPRQTARSLGNKVTLEGAA